MAAKFSFSMYTEPFALRYGEVFNAVHADCMPMSLPSEVVQRYLGTRRMAIFGYEWDIVRRRADGSESNVPLYELYNHHHDLRVSNLIGNGTHDIHLPGAFDFRGLHTVLPAPYRHVVDTPSGAACISLHLINLRNPLEPFRGTPSPLLECPCTEIVRQRLVHGKWWRRQGKDRACNDDVLAGNPACSTATYTGGMRCCDANRQSLLNTSDCPILHPDAPPDCTQYPVDEGFLFKAKFHYEDAWSGVRHVQDARCCGIAREFDVVPCAPSTPPHLCVRRFERVVPMTPKWKWELVEVPYMRPHVHEGAISIELLDAMTNHTLCFASRADGGIVYGSGNNAGNEAGYLVGFRECIFGASEAPLIAPGHPLRIISYYNATKHITGAMATMQLKVHGVQRDSTKRINNI